VSFAAVTLCVASQRVFIIIIIIIIIIYFVIDSENFWIRPRKCCVLSFILVDNQIRVMRYVEELCEVFNCPHLFLSHRMQCSMECTM
jgi:hypothetical protein